MCIILITIYLLIEVVKQHNQSVKNVQRPQPQAYYLSQSQRKLELSERGFWDKRPMGSGGIFWNNMEIMCLGMFILPVHFLCFALCFKELINNFLKIVELAAVTHSKKSVFKWHCRWSAGVNDAWCQDQHDKWGQFGLWLHASLDSFTGFMNWVNCLWTNKNLKLISSYYFACVCQEGGKSVDFHDNFQFLILSMLKEYH